METWVWIVHRLISLTQIIAGFAEAHFVACLIAGAWTISVFRLAMTMHNITRVILCIKGGDPFQILGGGDICRRPGPLPGTLIWGVVTGTAQGVPKKG